MKALTRHAVALACFLLGCNKAPSGSPQASASAASPANVSAGAPAPEAPLAPPDASVSALLSGLKVGDELGSARVVEVFGINDGRIPIHIASGTSQGWLEISLRSEEPQPPVSTEYYSVYWTMRGIISDRMLDETISEACVKLGERLRTVELTMTPPQALKKFPKSRPVAL